MEAEEAEGGGRGWRQSSRYRDIEVRGGLLMKRYRLSVFSGALLSFVTSVVAFFLFLLLHLGTKCEHVAVAGLTVSYNG